MQLLLLVIKAEDTDRLSDSLFHQGLRLTRIDSSGGFLQNANVTYLLAVENDQVEHVLSIVKDVCATRPKLVNANPSFTGSAHSSPPPIAPVEVSVGGGVVIILPIKGLAKLQEGSLSRDQTERDPHMKAEAKNDAVNLILAVVHPDYVEIIASAVTSAGYPLTRVNSSGGFLRRNSVTFLVAVHEQEVEGVLDTIGRCSPKTPVGSRNSLSEYESVSTIFIMEAKRIVRI